MKIGGHREAPPSTHQLDAHHTPLAQPGQASHRPPPPTHPGLFVRRGSFTHHTSNPQDVVLVASWWRWAGQGMDNCDSTIVMRSDFVKRRRLSSFVQSTTHLRPAVPQLHISSSLTGWLFPKGRSRNGEKAAHLHPAWSRFNEVHHPRQPPSDSEWGVLLEPQRPARLVCSNARYLLRPAGRADGRAGFVSLVSFTRCGP